MNVVRVRCSRTLSGVFWLVATAVLFAETVRAHGERVFGMDFRPTYFAARNLRVNGDPYLPVHGQLAFVYPPSCALLFTPITWVGDHAAAFGGMLLAAASLVLIATASGWLAERRPFGIVAGATLALIAANGAGWSTIALGNLSAITAAGLAWALVLIGEDQWLAAGCLLGLAVSVKPLIVPAVLVFLLARQWRGLGAAAAVPVALNLAAVPLLRHPGDFVTKVVPALSTGDTLQLRYNASIAGFGERHGVPDPITWAIRILLIAVAAGLVALAYRSGEKTRFAAIATIPVTVLCLIAPIDESHYDLAMIPFVVMLAAAPRQSRAVRILALAAFGLLAASYTTVELGTGGQLLVLAAAAAAFWPSSVPRAPATALPGRRADHMIGSS